jgi:hypothetical protein
MRDKETGKSRGRFKIKNLKLVCCPNGIFWKSCKR